MYDHTTGKLTLYNLRQGVKGSLEVYKYIEVAGDMTYNVFVSGMKVGNNISILENMPSIVSGVSDLKYLLEIVNASNPCIGNPDPKFESLVLSRSGKLLNRSGKCIV